MFIAECALCGKPEPWYVMTKKPPGDLPLQHGDLVCKACSETLPKAAQDLLHWASRELRRRYLAGELG